MSDLKIVSEPAAADRIEAPQASVPVPVTEAALTRRDLDLIKRDLISVRKDYREIRDNMVVLTHQYSRAPSRSFFIGFGILWLVLLAGLLIVEPHLAQISTRVAELLQRHGS